MSKDPPATQPKSTAKAPRTPAVYDDVTALARCTAILKRLPTASDRAAVAAFLYRKFCPQQLELPASALGNIPPCGAGG